MTIQDVLQSRNMSIYRLSKTSGIAYATVNDIVNGRTQLEKCSAETVYRIAQALNISMEKLLEPCLVRRCSFENFKSTICHRVKEMGDLDFMIDILESDLINRYYEWKWYPESLYLLAMLDYLSRENDIPLCEDYEYLRHCKLEKPVFPASILAISAATKSDAALKQAEETAIPEFRRFNIIEKEVRNVV